VLWISASTHYDIASSFVDIAKKLQIHSSKDPDSDRHNVVAWLASTDKSWLIVVDDLDNLDAANLLSGLLTTSHGAVIITSRNPHINAEIDSSEELHVEPFSGIDGANLLKHLQHRIEVDDLEENTAALQISTIMGGLPLAINSVSDIAISRHLTLDRILRMYQRDKTRFLSRINDKSTDTALSTVFELSYAVLPPTAASLLGVLAYLDPDVIPIDLLRIVEEADVSRGLMDELATLEKYGMIMINIAN
jgi:hypothetical protein